MTGSETDVDDQAQIYVSIHLNKRLGVLPPMAQRSVEWFKGILFAASVLLLGYLALRADNVATLPIRIAAVAGTVWMVWDRVLKRNRYGRSQILVTSRGVLLSEYNFYARWEDIASYRFVGPRLRFKCREGCGPSSFSAPSELDIPLTDKNREILGELFRERVAD